MNEKKAKKLHMQLKGPIVIERAAGIHLAFLKFSDALALALFLFNSYGKLMYEDGTLVTMLYNDRRAVVKLPDRTVTYTGAPTRAKNSRGNQQSTTT